MIIVLGLLYWSFLLLLLLVKWCYMYCGTWSYSADGHLFISNKSFSEFINLWFLSQYFLLKNHLFSAY